MENPKFIIYQKMQSGKYYWELTAGNGEVIAISPGGYASHSECKNAIASVQRNCHTENIKDRTK